MSWAARHIFLLSVIITVVLCGSLLLVQVAGGEDIGCQPTQKEADRIVVTCAEMIICEYAELVDREILYMLMDDGVVIGKDEDPFGEHYRYIQFKTDYYREMFHWGKLPPEDIMRKAKVK